MLLFLGKTIFGDMIREISSKSNDFIKSVVKLKQKKNRDGLFLIEGERFVFEAIRRKVRICAVLFVEEPSILGECDSIDCVRISPSIAQMLSSTVSPSGVFAVVDYASAEFELPKGDFLVLDRISDPGNLGTIIRSALAFGFREIYMLSCVDWRNDKVLRATMGTIFDVNLYPIGSDEIKLLSEKFSLLTADMHGTNIFEFERDSAILGLVLGNEANGVSPELRKIVSEAVSVPMQNDVESLNVAVAGAILMSKLSN